MIDTNTATTVTVCEVAAGDTIVVDHLCARVRAEVLRTEQVDYAARTLVVVYRESDTGALREWRTGFLTRVGTY
jgi:hypothetical protein